MVNISHGGNAKSASYIMRESECEEISTNLGIDKEDVIKNVKAYCDIEQNGSKELGIRAARFEARNMTKLIISLPNKNSVEENTKKLNRVLERTGVKEYQHITAIHRGEKDGIQNKHAHVHFFERKFEQGNSKKNREFVSKNFLDDFRREYQREFGLEVNQEQRQRLTPKEYKDVQELNRKNKLLITEVKNLQNEREREPKQEFELTDDFFSKLNEEFGRNLEQSNQSGQQHGGALQQAIEREKSKQLDIQRAREEAERKLAEAERAAEQLAKQPTKQPSRTRGDDNQFSY